MPDMNRTSYNEYTKQGYAVISRKYGIMARIDRPDWREYMALQHAPWCPTFEGMAWVRAMGRSATGYYMSCHSQDRIEVPYAHKKAPNSCFVKYDYVPLDRDPEFSAECAAIRDAVRQDADQWRLGFCDAIAVMQRNAVRFTDAGSANEFVAHVIGFDAEAFLKQKA